MKPAAKMHRSGGGGVGGVGGRGSEEAEEGFQSTLQPNFRGGRRGGITTKYGTMANYNGTTGGSKLAVSEATPATLSTRKKKKKKKKEGMRQKK